MIHNNTSLSENLEDYLETIFHLENVNKVARVKDIAEKLGVMRGSVTGALKSLAEKDLINYEPYSFITLTRKGATIAREISRRHAVIKSFLKDVLQLDGEKAETNACRMEHAMDKAAIDRLVQFIDYIHTCPRTGADWITAFVDYYSKKTPAKEKCDRCMDACMTRHLESKPT